ncbi:hypothetical protein GZH49_36355 [Nocardia terpenica]|uniref:hypothetical protein n=1 Tax=Nocardia terpenica TaxID=455432 RepID=UPI002FDFEB79
MWAWRFSIRLSDFDLDTTGRDVAAQLNRLIGITLERFVAQIADEVGALDPGARCGDPHSTAVFRWRSYDFGRNRDLRSREHASATFPRAIPPARWNMLYVYNVDEVVSTAFTGRVNMSEGSPLSCSSVSR